MKKSLLITIFAAVSLLPVHAQQPDSVITEILSASVITEGNITYKVDRTTHFFSAAEVKAGDRLTTRLGEGTVESVAV